jgi:hypothetical protein
MTVNELIQRLQLVEDKERQVAAYSMFGSLTYMFEVNETDDEDVLLV